MKQTLPGLLALVIISITFTLSCKKDQSAKNTPTEVTASEPETSSAKQFHIYFADWDEWGRTSRSCAGWGLCHFRDCWFCCTDERDNIVSCKDNIKVTMSGKAVIDPDTQLGVMYIKMDPSDDRQQEAIINKSVFYVDEDVVGQRFIVLAGEYNFDPAVGDYGGYILNVKEK